MPEVPETCRIESSRQGRSNDRRGLSAKNKSANARPFAKKVAFLSLLLLLLKQSLVPPLQQQQQQQQHMCRWITLLSTEEVALSDLVIAPSNGLIQLSKDASFHPGYTHQNNHVMNGDGFG